jgi:Predicted membrane protein (DUF2232)
MMARPLIIGIGSGLIAAALFASAAMATPLAGVLFYLAPLPLCLAGLGWGGMTAPLSVLAGSIIVAASLGSITAGIFAVLIAVPAALLTHLALLSRPVPASEGQQSATLEWYPPGSLVGWAAVLAGLLAGMFVLYLGYDHDSYRDSVREILNHSALKDLGRDESLFTEESFANFSDLIARALPAAFSIIWLSVMLFNLWIAGLIVDASGHALRPWPDLHGLELPNRFLLIFAPALVASFLPGLPGLLATGLAGALLFAYTLQGLAVIHVYSRGASYRPLLLGALYLGILLFGWVAIVVAIIGLAEPSLDLRGRATRNGQPPAGNGTI